MTLFRVEVQRIMRTIYEVEADHEKAAIAALSETEQIPLVDEEWDSEIMSVVEARSATALPSEDDAR